MASNIEQKWAVYESNVQQYRVISVTVQSFFLAVGSIWFTATTPPPFAFKFVLFVIGVGHIFLIWIPIVLARIRIVDYYKMQLDLSDPSIPYKEIMLPENANERAATLAAILRYRHHCARAAFAAEWQAYRAA